MATNRTFKEIIDIMEDVSGKMPEGDYINLYNKIRDLKKTCDSRQSQEARLESFHEGYAEAESDLQYERNAAVYQYQEKCARLTVEISEYKKELDLEQERFQEIYDLNKDNDEEIANLKTELDKRKREVYELTAIRARDKQAFACMNAKLSCQIAEMKKTIEIFNEEKRERAKASADKSKPVLLTNKRCKCGSTIHFRTNHKDCRLNKNNVNPTTVVS